MECILLLKTNFATDLKLILKDKRESNIVSKSNICGVVYSDMAYEGRLIFDEEILDVKIFVNNILRESIYNNGNIYFHSDDFFKNKIFFNYFGYVTINVKILTANNCYEFYSNYIDVAIRDNISSDIIRKMIGYISSNSNKYLFKEESQITDFSDIYKSEKKNIQTEISMLENIIFEYESNIKYFKTSAKFKTVNNSVVDDFEKLKEIKEDTIQYILTNPQELRSVNYKTGIRYNKLNLKPQKTLVNKNSVSYNTYENQVVLGFLKYIYNIVSSKIKEIEDTVVKEQTYSIRAEYISFSNEIYSGVKEVLNNYIERFNLIKNKLQRLYFIYKQILKCDEVLIKGIPKPSIIFLETQNYRKIYIVIKDWFESGNYNLENEKMLLTFTEVSEIYEYYVLFKINEYIYHRGYTLNKSSRFKYILKKNAKYINTKYENTFIFEKSDIKITVYYQPVVYFHKIVDNNDLGLFRNNNISLDGEIGEYYTPDYIIKISKEDGSTFIILDAKWSNIDSVKKYSFKKIIHNYIFSISTIRKNDSISKIWIVNGKEKINQQEYLYNAYNSKYDERNKELNPSIKFMTLNPNVDIQTEERLFDELLVDLI